MKCKYCGKEFKFKPRKLFCDGSCREKYRYKRSKKKKKYKCIVCGKALNRGGKYCSKDCYKAKRRADYAQSEKVAEARKAATNLYLKEYNTNIERCLNCENKDCNGMCEAINEFIKG